MTEELKAKLEAVKTLTARRDKIWRDASPEALQLLSESHEITRELQTITESLKNER